jgi:3-oxoacyl-[acyl-carrier protein] reductase
MKYPKSSLTFAHKKIFNTMDLKIKNQWFLVGGATSGFGKATVEKLIEEEANVLAIARNNENLLALQSRFPSRCKIFPGDLCDPQTIQKLNDTFDLTKISGAFINAGGPPALRFMDTSLANWDEAYNLLIRWKVALTQLLIPYFLENKYGKLVFVESVSVKQPIENLVLSNSLRMAVVGFVKTLSMEVSGKNITMNIMAPGYHDTPAVQRVFRKKAELSGISMEEARKGLLDHIPAGVMGNPSDFASLAAWLLSPLSNYVTGQTITVDGGSVKASFG